MPHTRLPVVGPDGWLPDGWLLVKIAASIAELETIRAELSGGLTRPNIAYVPTMGALHEGHLSLLRMARSLADVVILSIFVNPLQFGPDEDYAQYPRMLESDLAAAEAAGVDVVFTPTVTEVYPAGRQISVNSGTLGSVLEGVFRPGHFDGVLTVVLKLFHLVRPDIAIFGRKDAQQLACVRRMVLDLNLDINIVGAPIIREGDGLALSSRNRYLSAPERATATILHACLEAAADQPTPAAAQAAAERLLAPALATGEIELNYLTIANPATMAKLPEDYTGPALALIAARVGSTRLIDNVELTFQPAQPAPEPTG